MERVRPLFLPTAAGAVFGMLHEPAPSGAALRRSILLVPPWGWEEVASHRERRAWAMHLADAGYRVLRIDLPGTGDSSGAPSDAGLADAWVAAVDRSARWLRGEQTDGLVAAIGLGVGGLMASCALAAGAPIDELVLWGAPVRGRSFVREARAFGLLQSRAYGMDEVAGLPQGAIEAAGFVLSAETAAGIGKLDASAASPGPLRRALILARDGIQPAPALSEHLEAEGVTVTAASGQGWAAMCVHPEKFSPPRLVFAAVDEWFGAAGGPAPALDAKASASRVADAPPRWRGDGFAEEAFLLDDAGGSLFGVLATPVDGRTRLCAIFLNAGAVRHIGPNRMWVEAARRWAALGVSTLRIDVEGIGESGGDDARYRNVAEFYRPDVERQVRRFLALLDDRWPARPRVLIGLCAGGYWAAQVAAADPAVSSAVLVNAGALVWDGGLLDRRRARGLARLRRAGGWRQMVEAGVSIQRVALLVGALAGNARRSATRGLARAAARARGRARPDRFQELFGTLARNGTETVIAFSGDEPLAWELEEDGVADAARHVPNIRFVDLPGADHTLRPIGAQAALQQLLDAEISAALKRAPEGDPPIAHSGHSGA
jgi:alpha-beta hydrolase superfamily lysophospholipase